MSLYDDFVWALCGVDYPHAAAAQRACRQQNEYHGLPLWASNTLYRRGAGEPSLYGPPPARVTCTHCGRTYDKRPVNSCIGCAGDEFK